MNAPRFLIWVEFERNAPKVLPCWEREGDRTRLYDWLAQRPALQRLVDDAIFLSLQDEPLDDPSEWEEAA